MPRTPAAPLALPFDPLISQWFLERFGEPTEAQRRGWPEIVAGRNTLIAAPTGSGKTLAAFLASLDRLFRLARQGQLPDTIQVVYVSPLKALSNDIQRNLEAPLDQIARKALDLGVELPAIRATVRTGDTPAAERQAMLRRPPHILVTTPESLYLMLTADKSRELLRDVQTVIVDEIHALARDKRGSHLTLTLERLELLARRPPVRIGLSATQRPMDEIARFLVGSRRVDADGRPDCAIIDVGHLRELDLAVLVPPSELGAVCSHEQWDEIYQELGRLIESHRSTLVFVNTRRLAERVAHRLIETLGADAVASHHGSLAREIRLSAEQRLKSGQLRAIVATASLEMGIDVGFIDLVCQIGTPRSIATLLQRVGRSGHALGLIPRGRILPLTRDELIECLALVRCVNQRRLDQVRIPTAPLDVLAQQIVAMASAQEWNEDELFDVVRRAWPYHGLCRRDYDAVLTMLTQGLSKATKHGAYLYRDQIGRRLKARRGARIAALTSGGTIPETGDYRVVTEEDRTFLGTVNEDFALESLAGDIFLLGNHSWRIRYVRSGEVVVTDAQAAPATVPFWLGEGPGRTDELSHAVSQLRQEVADRVGCDDEPALDDAVAWLQRQCHAQPWAAQQAARYIAAQRLALGTIPTQRQVIFERFFDESGGMQVVIHAPFGSRVNRAWGLALRKRFCRSFDFELQAAADDNAILLSIGPQHSFPIDALFRMLNTQNAEHLLVQALLAAPMFPTRWRWNVTRALAVLRQRGGKPVPPFLQRFRADDLLAAVFPQQVGCLENHSGDIAIPDHPMVAQTLDDCLHEAMDVDAWKAVLRQFESGAIQFTARQTREPSPFAHEILNANPYAFLDDAPLEERRVRAVSVRRTLSIEATRDLGRLDPAAIAHVSAEAWPVVRDADELHDTLLTLVALRPDEAAPWRGWFDVLVAAGRACVVRRADQPDLWIAAERWPVLAALMPQAVAQPPVRLPAELAQPLDRGDAMVALIRGRLQSSGPLTATKLADDFGLSPEAVAAALEALEGEGLAMRGYLSAPAADAGNASSAQTRHIEWCDRRLLARIHRLTLDGLRRQIEPVDASVYLRFLARHQRAAGEARYHGSEGVRAAIEQLQGFEMPAGVWEGRVLPARVDDYVPAMLDQLSMSGMLVWGRLRPPARSATAAPSTSGMTRAAGISLMLREDLGWLLPRERPPADAPLRSGARLVVEALRARGALFYHELLAATELLEAHLDDALRELAALGMVTADTFAAVRWIAARDRSAVDRRRRRARRQNRPFSPALSGRWSLFPGLVRSTSREEYRRRWADQLLRRWGVVFRDLLARESLAPPWSELVMEFRRMEARGEVRGGRFVAGVGGEQYALAQAVDQLRQLRDAPPDDSWLVLSAADPLNLSGIVTDQPRVPAIHTNTVALRDGRIAASRYTGGTRAQAEQVGSPAFPRAGNF
jgi:ATP-dependent Lhr-like helicase